MCWPVERGQLNGGDHSSDGSYGTQSALCIGSVAKDRRRSQMKDFVSLTMVDEADAPRLLIGAGTD